jgi:hypothetical protein
MLNPVSWHSAYLIQHFFTTPVTLNLIQGLSTKDKIAGLARNDIWLRQRLLASSVTQSVGNYAATGL